jgi:hypothetical protein
MLPDEPDKILFCAKNCYLVPTRAPSCSRRSAISTYPRLAARCSAVTPLLSYRRVIWDLGISVQYFHIAQGASSDVKYLVWV